MAVKEDAAQLKADKAALQRQLKRLDADEARLKVETSSGKMSAESTDALEVYRAQEAVKGEKAAIAADKDGSLQMKMDRAALHRQIKRLDVAEARLSAALCAVLDLPNLAAITREKQAEPSKPSGTPLFA